MSRLPGLDLLRALAILWVMLSHAQGMGLVSDDNLMASSGWMGVDLFFVLSGFLIGGQLLRPFARGEPVQFGRFYARRLLRTLPPYLVVLALYFTVPAFRERPTIQPLWQFLTFTENLFIDFTHPRAFSHVWSLCVEEQFYLVAPIVVWGLMRRRAAWTVFAICAGLLVGGMALRGYIWLHDLAPIQHVTQGPGNFNQRFMERIYYPTWTRLDDLSAGLSLAAIQAFRPAWWSGLIARANLALAAGLTAVALSIWLFVDQEALAPSVIGYPILAAGMALLVAAGASPRSLIGRWRIPGVGAIAAMAYSLYLTHKETYHLVFLAVGHGLDGRPILADVIYGAVALAGGALLYAAAERPALWLRERLMRGERRAGAAAPNMAGKMAEA